MTVPDRKRTVSDRERQSTRALQVPAGHFGIGKLAFQCERRPLHRQGARRLRLLYPPSIPISWIRPAFAIQASRYNSSS
jgi:hypothetical protein